MNTLLKLPITVMVHTRNSAATLEQCLRSVPQVKEVLVVDMNSTDDTGNIARRFHARTLSVPDTGFVEPARETALQAAGQPWILILDADEYLPEGSAEWLSEIITAQEAGIYELPRRNIMFGKALEYTGWWPDYQVRLFRKGMVRWPGEIHAKPEFSQKSVKLPATEKYAIVHENYQHIAQFIDRMNRYTTIEAQQHPQANREWLTAFCDEFFSRLLAKHGWKDHDHGLALSLLQAYYPLVTQLKIWEAKGFEKSNDFENRIGSQLNKAARDLSYWRADYFVSKTMGISRLYWQIRRKFQI